MAVKNKLYEAMFLVDAADSQDDWDGVESNIRNILARVDAEIISLEKWDTRRLVYAIDKKSMGTYILCYFRADGKRIAEIERTVQLSERIMRVLILSADHVTQSDIEKDTSTIVAEKPEQPTGAGPGETAAVQAGVETVSAEEISEAEAAPAEVSREAAGPVSVEEDSKSEPEAAAVAEETLEESKELEEQAKPRGGRKMHSEKAEAVAEASEAEKQVEDQAKDGSESTDEQGTEKSEEKEE